MKLSFLLFLFLFSFYVHAKPNRNLVYKPKPKPNYSSNPAASTLPTYTQPYGHPTPNSMAANALVAKSALSFDETPPARLRFSPLLGIKGGLLGYGGMGEVLFSTGAPFFIGVQSGYLQFDGFTSSGEEEWMSIIPVTATFMYRFNLSSGPVHPYIGLGIGVSLANGVMEEEGTITPLDSTQTDFLITGRPGVEFQLSRVTSFFLEPQLGLLQNHFVFLPQAGFAFDF